MALAAVTNNTYDMTLEEFDNAEFKPSTVIIYTPKQWQHHVLVGVNFEERLLQIKKPEGQGDKDSFWVRCENIELQ